MVHFEELPNCFPKWLCHFIDTFPPALHEVSNFSTSLPSLVIFIEKTQSHPRGYEVVSQCGFGLHFPNDL